MNMNTNKKVLFRNLNPGQKFRADFLSSGSIARKISNHAGYSENLDNYGTYELVLIKSNREFASSRSYTLSLNEEVEVID